MEQETQVCIFLSLLWKELIGVSEFPFAISSAGCQRIAHLLWERPAGKRDTARSLLSALLADALIWFPGPAAAAPELVFPTG